MRGSSLHIPMLDLSLEIVVALSPFWSRHKSHLITMALFSLAESLDKGRKGESREEDDWASSSVSSQLIADCASSSFFPLVVNGV